MLVSCIDLKAAKKLMIKFVKGSEGYNDYLITQSITGPGEIGAAISRVIAPGSFDSSNVFELVLCIVRHCNNKHCLT